MKITKDIKNFIEEYVEELLEGRASLMIGAGMSKASGLVDWKKLLSNTAKKLDLDIDIETDLLAVAQYDINKINSKNNITTLILNEFSKKVKITENHTIIANLPISTIWTTNYDCLIEKSFEAQGKIIDVKKTVNNLSTHKDKRDVVIYKMHGDVG